MTTTQERRPETDPADDLGTVTINDLLEEGNYVSSERYTVAQQEEIAVIAREAMRAGVRMARPDWDSMVKVERTERGNGS